jgi:hypothetical protein
LGAATLLKLKDMSTPTTEQPKYYRFSFRGVKLDPYRILQVYGITNPAHQHALKKLLRAGNSVKPLLQDIDEVILSLNRWKEMLNEEEVTTQQETYVEKLVKERVRQGKLQPDSGGRRRVRPSRSTKVKKDQGQSQRATGEHVETNESPS